MDDEQTEQWESVDVYKQSGEIEECFGVDTPETNETKGGTTGTLVYRARPRADEWL